MPDRHIFLIGMQGCGKSSLGKRVARETGLSFADTDAMVAASVGGTVNDFFEKYGEETFRKAETGALALLTRAKPMMISTGGGTVMNPVNRHIMRSWGTIVLAGLVGTSRLVLKCHTVMQVLAGFALGYVCVTLAMKLFG